MVNEKVIIYARKEKTISGKSTTTKQATSRNSNDERKKVIVIIKLKSFFWPNLVLILMEIFFFDKFKSTNKIEKFHFNRIESKWLRTDHQTNTDFLMHLKYVINCFDKDYNDHKKTRKIHYNLKKRKKNIFS